MLKRRVAVVLSLLALLHMYIGMRLIPAIGLAGVGYALAVLFLAASTVLMPMGLIATRVRKGDLADRLAWVGLLVMGLFSSLLVLTFLRDLLLLLLEVAGMADADVTHATAVGVPLLALGVTVVGFFNARRTARVVEVEVPIKDLPASLDGYSIVQISDVHVGPTIKRKYIDAIVNRVNALEPDAIAVTGDVVDGSVHRLAPHTAPLGRLAARDGTFFVTGNHEYYSGAHEWIAEMRRLGLTVLINQHVIRERDGQQLLIAGVPDYTAHLFDASHKSDPQQAAAGAPDNVAVKILLAHQPRTAPAAADAGFDLQLSGHTHGGQFFPWNLFVPLQQPFVAGLNRLKNLWVYTSRGTGYWGPPKRFGAPSEITRVRLVPAK
ncbi:metallophosphoesterase [Zemynaea arenosa]|nr:metallophosphoesterase [Massilia arenosa]